MRAPWSSASSCFGALALLHIASAGSSDISRASNDSLLWGPYRPNLYFGIRPTIPQSLMTGLLWSKVEDLNTVQHSFRYTCEQNEFMKGYGWDQYDSRTGGIQIIHDAENLLDITTEFVRIPGGEHGGSWGARIRGTPRADAPKDLKSTVVFAVSLDGQGVVDVANQYDELGYEGNVSFEGQTEELGAFKLEVTRGPRFNAHPESEHPSSSERPLDRTMVRSLRVPEHATWQAKALMFQEMKSHLDDLVEEYTQSDLPPPWQLFTVGTNDAPGSNVHLVQKVFEGNFQFDVLFSSSSAPEPVTSEVLSTALKASSKSFQERFQAVFKPSAPFDKFKYDPFLKSLFSNLLGGIGYFYGDQIIDRSYDAAYDEDNEGFWEDAAEARAQNSARPEGPYELFTAVPSRPFFPRGFLWDEGFHLLPVADWDVGLTLEILKSWFTTMDNDGWIPREQILGHEARTKVPPEFAIQYPHYANPPTLFNVIELLLDKVHSKSVTAAESQSILSAFKSMYPLLKRNYEWYRRTQRGDLRSYDRPAFSSREGYRWRGRTPSHILTSGLDDYPRAQPPHPGELHVDLISWMGLMARNMKRIATSLEENDDAASFADHETAIRRNIDDLHWDEQAKTYCDATIDQYEESVHECHKGYVSIFPFLTGMLAPNSPHLGSVLDLLADHEELWSPHGIRSLSTKDAAYGTAENYWRSPVWMNINYLVVENLLRIAQVKGPSQEHAVKLYTELRNNLVDTVYDSWSKTGFAWEQYNPDTGAGQRTQHFTGWTSLVVKIMCMPDLDEIRHSEL